MQCVAATNRLISVLSYLSDDSQLVAELERCHLRCSAADTVTDR